MRKVFEVNIWDVIDIEKLNTLLDEALGDDVMAEDISYEIVSVNSNGISMFEANFSEVEL